MKYLSFHHVRQTVILYSTGLLYAFLAQKAIVSGEALVIMAIPGAFIGYYLFNKPIACFWVIFFAALLDGPFVSYIPGLFNLRWGVNLLATFLGINILLRFIIRRQDFRAFNNIFFLLLGLFLVLAITSSVINQVPAKQLIIAGKNNFSFFLLLPFFALYRIPSKFSSQIKKALFIVAVIQPPLALFQFYFIVPKLINLTGNNTTSVLDSVNGSFGTSLQGGGTGTFTFWTCTILSGLLAIYSRKIITTRHWFLLSLYLLAPMFINETKAGFLFLLAGSMVVIIFPWWTRLSQKILLGMLAMVMAGIMVWTTLQMANSFGTGTNKMIEGTISHILGQKGYGKYHLNRLTVLSFWWQENRHDLTDLLIGNGLDSTMETGIGHSDSGSVARRYPLYGTGLTTASQMLWETGLIGFGLFIAVLIIPFRACIKLTRSRFLSKGNQVMALSVAAGLLLTFMGFFYNPMFRQSQSANFFIVLLLCLQIYLGRVHEMGLKQVPDAT